MIGGGAVGLAIGRSLSARQACFVIERRVSCFGRDLPSTANEANAEIHTLVKKPALEIQKVC